MVMIASSAQYVFFAVHVRRTLACCWVDDTILSSQEDTVDYSATHSFVRTVKTHQLGWHLPLRDDRDRRSSTPWTFLELG